MCTFHIVIDICCSSDEEISASFDGDDNCEEELEYSDDYEQVGKWVRWMSLSVVEIRPINRSSWRSAFVNRVADYCIIGICASGSDRALSIELSGTI